VRAVSLVEAIEVPKKAIAPLLENKPDLSCQLAAIMTNRKFSTKATMDAKGRKPTREMMKRYAQEMLGKIRGFFNLDAT
jgi:hypothetical protein